MKTLGFILLFAFANGAITQTVTFVPSVPIGSNFVSLAPLSIVGTYSTRTTNWYPSGDTSTTLVWSGADGNPNTITHYETGAICSNFIARIQFNGTITNVVVQSSEIARVSRYYTEKQITVREYSAPW